MKKGKKQAKQRKAPQKTERVKRPSPKLSKPRRKVSEVLEQVKEPLSLLQTLKEEGMANAFQFLHLASTVAGEAKKNLSSDLFRHQIKEVVGSLGFALRSDLERLENRLDDLEEKLSALEYNKLSDEE